MPVLILSRRRGAGEETFSFTSRLALRPQPTAFLFRSYLRPREVVPVAFASLALLRSPRVPFSFRSVVALRPAGSPEVGMPVQVIAGQRPLAWAVSCELGQAVRAEYEHAGDSETLTMTLQVEPSAVGETVALYATLGDAPAVARHLTVDTRQYEVTRTRGQGVSTVIRAYNAAAERARTFALPELVPWVTSPRLDYPSDYVAQSGIIPAPSAPQLPPLREVGVSDLVRRAFGTAGVGFSIIGTDPFAGETWQEGRRETSTGGRTPADLFGDTYGALGYRLIVRGGSLFGLPPGGSLTGQGLAFTPCEVESLTERGEAAQVPARIHVSAAPRTVLGPEVPQETDPEKEADPDSPQTDEDKARSWNEMSPTENGFTVSTGYVWNGLLREEQQVEIGRVEVTETVDDKAKTRVFDRVLISDTRTTYQYHPQCPEAVVRQVTTKRGYGYGLGTALAMRGVVGVLFGASLPGGDLVENQTEIVTQSWYESGDLAGYIKTRRTEGKRLVSVQQEGAEEEPAKRGALEAREYVGQVLAEIYRRIGPLWHRYYATTGGASVPLYDLDSQEAVRLAVRTGPLQTGSEIMRNDPPRVTWPKAQAADPEVPAEEDQRNPDRMRNEIEVPQHAAYAVAGGSAATLEQDFPMLQTDAKLSAFAMLLAHTNGPRVVQEAQLSVPRGLLPGTLISSPVTGVVERLSLSVESGSGTASLTAAQVGLPALTPVPWPATNDRERGFVMAVAGNRVSVDVPEVGTRVAALLTGFAQPQIGSVVEIRVNSAGAAVIAGGG